MEKGRVVSPETSLERRTDCRNVGFVGRDGKTASRTRNIVTSVELDPLRQERFNHKLTDKYRTICEREARCEMVGCDDADYVIVAYGSSARISQKVVELAAEDGLKVGLLRPHYALSVS